MGVLLRVAHELRLPAPYCVLQCSRSLAATYHVTANACHELCILFGDATVRPQLRFELLSEEILVEVRYIEKTLKRRIPKLGWGLHKASVADVVQPDEPCASYNLWRLFFRLLPAGQHG